MNRGANIRRYTTCQIENTLSLFQFCNPFLGDSAKSQKRAQILCFLSVSKTTAWVQNLLIHRVTQMFRSLQET